MARRLAADSQLALLRVLADGQWHGGTGLARRFDLTRATISQRVARLADWGLNVETHRAHGYRLVGGLELLDAGAIRASADLGDALAIDVAGWIDSTNARLLDEDGSRDPCALLAEGQSAGRGRRERPWVSPPGRNVYLSLAWRFQAWPEQIGCLSLAMGVAVWRLLRRHRIEAGIKWPNDLWVDGRKLAGLLIEHRGEFGAGCRVVVGLGMNTAPVPVPPGLDGVPPISLAELPGGAGLSRNRMAGELLRALYESLRDFEREGFAPFSDDYQRADLLRGVPVRVQHGAQWRDGMAAGIRGDGALLLRRDGALEPVHAGEVRVRPA